MPVIFLSTFNQTTPTSSTALSLTTEQRQAQGQQQQQQQQQQPRFMLSRRVDTDTAVSGLVFEGPVFCLFWHIFKPEHCH